LTLETKCEKALYVKDIFNNDPSKYLSVGGFPLNPDSIANPCGKIARSYFNERYAIFSLDKNKKIEINETGIASQYDIDTMYKREDNYTYKQWIDVKDEHLMVWMEMETFKNFMKIWGRIESILEPGRYVANITLSKNIY
jgi:hypothetical protein